MGYGWILNKLDMIRPNYKVNLSFRLNQLLFFFFQLSLKLPSSNQTCQLLPILASIKKEKLF
jgi:hypothetical protein